MPYTYPQIGATNPETTEPLPAMTYDFWIISTVAHTVQNVIEEGGSIKPIGSLTVRGQKFNYTDGVISPIGDSTEFQTSDLFESFETYPEFAAGYNAFVEVCAYTLELVEAEAILRTKDADTFEDALRQARKAWQDLDDDDDAAKAQECIQNYPGTWNEQQCLEYLGLADEATIQPIP